MQTDRGIVSAECRIAAVAVVGATELGYSLAGAGAVIAQPLLAQAVQRSAVSIMTFGLPDDVAIPVQAETLQCRQNAVGGARDFTRGVKIINAQ